VKKKGRESLSLAADAIEEKVIPALIAGCDDDFRRAPSSCLGSSRVRLFVDDTQDFHEDSNPPRSPSISGITPGSVESLMKKFGKNKNLTTVKED